jgi:2,3-bisphosphoglycerate-independent phosphoglycerate mutase
MDRDKRWERIKIVWFTCKRTRNTFENAIVTIEQSYQNQITDEFIDPIVMVDAVDQR